MLLPGTRRHQTSDKAVASDLFTGTHRGPFVNTTVKSDGVLGLCMCTHLGSTLNCDEGVGGSQFQQYASYLQLNVYSTGFKLFQ